MPARRETLKTRGVDGLKHFLKMLKRMELPQTAPTLAAEEE
jgi:hypothetical protein